MSTQTEITRLQNARNKIRAWLVGLGLAASTDKLDELATKAAAIKNQGAVNASVKEGESYTIPAGYHNGSGTVKGVAGGGNYSLQTKSVTPTKEQQPISPDQGYYGLSAVTVGAIPENYQDVSATTTEEGDVRANKVFIKSDGTTATGTLTDNGAVSKVLDATTGNQSYTVPAGIHNGKGAVSIVLENKTATPTKAAQDVTPTAGKVHVYRIGGDGITWNEYGARIAWYNADFTLKGSVLKYDQLDKSIYFPTKIDDPNAAVAFSTDANVVPPAWSGILPRVG